MSRNIKEIGKELLGKSLNSFHRKTGLPQLERNNEMQDGILDGILSQVDDAYIEKTEQSNVIHLESSGDGVVVLDSIEGNTMVNIAKAKEPYMAKENDTRYNTNVYLNQNLKANTTYTIITVVSNLKFGVLPTVVAFYDIFNFSDGTSKQYSANYTTVGIHKRTVTPEKDTVGITLTIGNNNYDRPNGIIPTITIDKLMILEGDWTNRELPPYFEGLQSSFEEQVENDKYKIEILMKNRNLFDITRIIKGKYQNHNIQDGVFSISTNSNWKVTDYIEVQEGETYYNKLGTGAFYDKNKNPLTYVYATNGQFTVPSGAKYVVLTNGIDVNWNDSVLQLKSITNTTYIPHKSNKIKLLINEPLRAVDNTKDRLCIKDGKLTIERNTFLQVLNGQEIWNMSDTLNTSNTIRYYTNALEIPMMLNSNGISDKIPYVISGGKDNMTCIYVHSTVNRIDIRKLNTDNRWATLEELKTWLRNNNVTLVLKRLEPIYEEVLNEYGEPILLEGYENGTIYIDSTIVPTTTVKYTPKMESFKTLKEVENNNIMLTNDVNDNIIPYMMDVDLMIMEKEMALMSHKNIRKMEVLDMTSMQKRTQDMLERLIKGKTLTEQECKTRVTTYLHAGKITDEQAEELMLLISEVYA